MGQYANPAYGRLHGIDIDLKLVQKAVQRIGFAPSQIRVLADADAALGGIETALQNWLISGVEANDWALFYFSGHGYQNPDLDGDEAEDGKDEVLLTYKIGIRNQTITQALTDDRLGELLAAIPAREILVLIDACHSGSVTRSTDAGAAAEQSKTFFIPICRCGHRSRAAAC